MKPWENVLLIVGIVALLCGGIVLISAVKTRIKERNTCEQYAEIVEIGGCRSNGNCGVKFDNGKYGAVYLPVVGHRRCIIDLPERGG